MLSEKTASKIAAESLGIRVASVERFTTGFCHYVYDVKGKDGSSVVVRISTKENRNYLRGGVFWNQELHRIGIPVPRLIDYDIEVDHPYMILERLPGEDLGGVYESLDSVERKRIAEELSKIQETVSSLGARKRFGYAISYSDIDTHGHLNWFEVIASNVQRSREWLTDSALASSRFPNLVEEILERYNDSLLAVRAIPYLDDITTKNVIISEGKLVGIVDTDLLCFGDSLRTIALTDISLRASKLPRDYIKFLLRAHKANEDNSILYHIYLLDFALNFLAETQQKFNGNLAYRKGEEYVNHISRIFESLLEHFQHQAPTSRWR